VLPAGEVTDSTAWAGFKAASLRFSFSFLRCSSRLAFKASNCNQVHLGEARDTLRAMEERELQQGPLHAQKNPREQG